MIRPDSAAALAGKIEVVLRRAAALARMGRDPEPDLRRAERYLTPSAESTAVAGDAARIRRIREAFRARL